MAKGAIDEGEAEGWRAKMREVLGEPSQELPEAEAKLAAAYRGFQMAAASELKPIINRRLVSLPTVPNEEKKQVIDNLRDLLTRLNLSIVCPISKQPSILYAIAPSSHNKHVQYWIKPRNAKSTTFTTVNIEDLVPIELTAGQQRQEGLSSWHQKVKGESKKPTGRG